MLAPGAAGWQAAVLHSGRLCLVRTPHSPPEAAQLPPAEPACKSVLSGAALELAMGSGQDEHCAWAECCACIGAKCAGRGRCETPRVVFVQHQALQQQATAHMHAVLVMMSRHCTTCSPQAERQPGR